MGREMVDPKCLVKEKLGIDSRNGQDSAMI